VCAQISVLIPTWQAGPGLERLLVALRGQKVPPAEVIVVDSSSTDGTPERAARSGCCVEVIPRERFNHGATRNMCADMAQGDILVFMTQDARPAGPFFLGELVRPIVEGRASASYARQVAHPHALPLERFARSFNYPSRSQVRTLDDVPRMGFRAFFFSNVASAVSREAFCAVGGFPDWVIMDEDVLLCARLLRAGYAVAYQAEAVVYHSHAYTLAQHFRRYFDIGTFVSQAGDVLQGARTGPEGMRYVWRQVRYLARRGEWLWIPAALVETAAKFAAFQLGLRQQHLPRALKQKLSLHAAFWDGEGQA
jgi:rhamnosyltransferase